MPRDLEIRTEEQWLMWCDTPEKESIIECDYIGMSYCPGNCRYAEVMKKYETFINNEMFIGSRL